MSFWRRGCLAEASRATPDLLPMAPEVRLDYTTIEAIGEGGIGPEREF